MGSPTKSNINYTLIKILKNLYEDSRSRIKQNNSLSMDSQYQDYVRDIVYYQGSSRFIYLRPYIYGSENAMEDKAKGTLQFADD
jgi:hypothetical protein